MPPLLHVNDLRIGFGKNEPTVDGVNFSVNAGETVAVVGESGSGKTLCCRAILQILPRMAQIRSGEILLHASAHNREPDQAPDRAVDRMQGGNNSVDLLQLKERQMRNIRGNRIAMIFQEPMRSLSPLHRIGDQVAEVLTLHRNSSAAEAKQRVLEEFKHVGFINPERAFRAYPFELSGGMQQRAMIAMATVAKPDLLIADEPTTALDMTTQAQVLDLLKNLQQETGMALLLVTHDLGVVANMADHVVVMNKGKVMESGTVRQVLGQPAHAYTRVLFNAAPEIPERIDSAPADSSRDIILDIKNVSKTYVSRSSVPWAPVRQVNALQECDLSVPRGKVVAIVGESGSGKSTCARIALGAEHSDPGGTVWFKERQDGTPVSVQSLEGLDKIAFQRKAQMVFQDPYSSLSPRMRILDALTEPLEIHGIGSAEERQQRAIELLNQVGLNSDMLQRYPHAFSGGQRQRLSIARALALRPQLLVCDEPTSALDVSVQAQILDLLEEIRDQMQLSYLFISHDLAVVARIADEVAVMRQGRIVEQAAPDALLGDPKHPYTKALIAAHPEPDLDRPIDFALVATGAGAPETWPEAFQFHGDVAPPLIEYQPRHLVRAHV